MGGFVGVCLMTCFVGLLYTIIYFSTRFYSNEFFFANTFVYVLRRALFCRHARRVSVQAESFVRA
jgi:hypothetical protein